MKQINNLVLLVSAIQQANTFFQDKAQRQVNKQLTLRNWVIGYYIVEYEQHGKDKAEYGEQTLKKLATRLKEKGLKSFSFTSLHLFKQFYQRYPQIIQSVTEQFQLICYQRDTIYQSMTDQFKSDQLTSADLILNRLTFTHLVELMGIYDLKKRQFYEIECIENNWSVRSLERAITSNLFERVKANKSKTKIEFNETLLSFSAKDIIKDPYVLEFLDLKENPKLIESDLEQRIIDHLQKFLLELGKGFCFEARQKRISISNTHLYVDLVFYHRILKCHVLIELKTHKFSPADAGQMNVYVNYYKDNEMIEGDNPPIGIILCTEKDATMVKYATAGMTENIFVSKYLSNLPSETQLKSIIEEEKQKLLDERKPSDTQA